MSTEIPASDSRPVEATGGTLDGTVTFNRSEATFDPSEETIKVPTNGSGTYIFKRDPKHTHQLSLDEVTGFRVGPIFHKPTDVSGDDAEMEALLQEYDVALLATFTSEDNEDYVHYVLDQVS